ncbi:VWA domain-containing protein [Lacinutrix sp. C3R15]|uniref:VWA domain-containing protein n=1 Tax=Flavobacteriaceae TaxID=49546 RepID=UPI001C08DAEB|nr:MULTISPECIES: VWA domain-containing protein [Flavobacteriaceae]MBU2940284.1 VWA domain-containing protein [Lacinutrix sp. C3R15]MDO6623603.1 VWA domain-containing protein [Oceanihabitans sp. 1_MG-2023]
MKNSKKTMTHSNNEIFTRFIKFGKISSEREREKITEIIKEWNYVSIETSNIDKRYLDTINSFITDEQIDSILSTQPHLKNEFIKKLIHLLEKIDANIENKPTFDKEEKLIQKYDKFQITELENGKTIFNKSTVLSEAQINNYEADLQLVIDDREKTKVNQFKKLHKNISNNWKRLIEKQPKTAIAQQLQKISDKSEEQQLKESFDKLSIDKFKKDWKHWNNHKEFLKSKYRKRDFDLNKYQEEFKAIENTEVKLNETNLKSVKSDFISKWEDKLSIEKLKQNIKIIDKTREQFLNDLYNKIEELKELLKLLSPFINETADLGRLWDMSLGNWQNVNFSLLEKYAQILKDKKEIQELAELLGKYRKAEAELEEEEFENIEVTSKYKIEHSGKSELIGITESDDLNNLLPTELALFSDLETESIFYKRFAEKKLQTFQYIHKENDFEQKSITDKRQKEIEKDKGPFIIAVDTSGSMHGEPEFLSKVIAFAITRIAISEKRKAFLISFSTGIETFELTDIQNSLVKLIDFLQMSFHGGTDASEAVFEALKQMETENYEKADLLIISDGVFGNLNNSTLKSIEELKKKGNKFNSLMIGNSYNERALKFCNNIWQYDPNYNELKDLIRKIKTDINKENAK